MMFLRSLSLAVVAASALAALSGCVERTISITSDPPGALVWLNDREVGRTPVEVEFLYYGTYDVRLVRDGYEPLMTKGEAAAPWWDLPGPDLAAEVMPFALQSDITWHYELLPFDDDRAALIGRADEMRNRSIQAGAEAEPEPNPEE